MEHMTVSPVCGLYREFYHPTPDLLKYSEVAKSKHNKNYLDANILFWSGLLSNNAVRETVCTALTHFSNLDSLPISYRAIVTNPEAFVARVLEAKIKVADQGISPREFFSYLETLNIYCALYAVTAVKNKIPFTIQSGWVLEEDSSKRLFDTCLDNYQNPYLDFIISTILPVIEDANPKVVFISGRPGYFSFALARLLKEHLPQIIICITRHSSEYYSLNKIDYLLMQNLTLFKAFDGVILEHFDETEKSIVSAISQHRDLCDVKNLIFINQFTIQQTSYNTQEQVPTLPHIEMRPQVTTSMKMEPHLISNVHLFPYVKCYWNRCNFCGINKKYHFENPENTYDYANRQLETMRECVKDISHIWFIDEALPPNVLRKIAIFFTEKMRGTTWQARCRIEEDLLLGDLPAILSASGLQELRLGLESASNTVLKNMNKFDDSFSLDLVEEICKKYTSHNISIHFPIIIGFPGESDSDRRATYTFLRDLTERYPKVTFNVNLYQLDVGSNVFQHWKDYEIQKIDFPCDTKYFIGNTLKWHYYQRDERILAVQRDQFMREQLYPWMPTRALTPPHIFYRLSETIRNTLIWKKSSLWPEQKMMHMPIKAKVADLSIIYDCKQDVHYIYSWSSHHFMLGNQSLVALVHAFETPCNISDALMLLYRTISCQTSLDELKSLVRRMLYEQYLLPCQ